MKILLVMDQFDDGNNGTTMTAKRLYKGLLERGNEVRVVSTGTPADYKYVVPAYHMPPVVRQIVNGQGMVFGRPCRDILYEAISWAEVVHFFMPFWLCHEGLRIAEELKVPHTAAFHVQPENITYTLHLGRSRSVNHFIYWFFRRWFYHSFTHIHCPSAFIAGQLAANGYRARLHVISNGVARDFQYRREAQKGEWEGKFVILMIGRLSNEKRQDVLIRGIAKSRYEDKIQLVLAGQGLKERAYKRMGKTLTNPPVIRFYSHEELIRLLSITDLYVHAADAEIEAIACIEAFSSGLVPVISNSPKSATKQFALTENNLFEAGSSGALSAKIDYWIEHEEERRAMERRYSEYGKQFGLDYCVGKMEEMFREAIEEQSGRREIEPVGPLCGEKEA